MLPFPCSSEFQIAAASFRVGEIRPRYRGKALKKGDNLLYLQNIIQIVFKNPQKKAASPPTVSQRGGGTTFLSAVYRERGNIFREKKD